MDRAVGGPGSLKRRRNNIPDFRSNISVEVPLNDWKTCN